MMDLAAPLLKRGLDRRLAQGQEIADRLPESVLDIPLFGVLMARCYGCTARAWGNQQSAAAD